MSKDKEKSIKLISEAVSKCAAICGGAPLRHFSEDMRKELFKIEKAANSSALRGDFEATKTQVERWLSAHKWAMDMEKEKRR